MKLVSKNNPMRHYQWGDGCDGWVLVDTAALSVKQERMPPNTAEALHYHKNSQQFFFILSGTALFEVGSQRFTVATGAGLYIEAGEIHRIINGGDEDLEFVLSSQPSNNDDRYPSQTPSAP